MHRPKEVGVSCSTCNQRRGKSSLQLPCAHSSHVKIPIFQTHSPEKRVLFSEELIKCQTSPKRIWSMDYGHSDPISNPEHGEWNGQLMDAYNPITSGKQYWLLLRWMSAAWASSSALTWNTAINHFFACKRCRQLFIFSIYTHLRIL